MRLRPHYFLVPVFALIATLPLIVHGCSCGHDFPFHLQSWLEAAQQWRHGTLYPHWAYSPAWQAGEPRFIFYPPLSWMLGAALMLLFPINSTPVLFTFLVLMAAGVSMYRLARHFAPDNAALIATAIYIANPYMMFNAFERAAYAELFASVWVPLVLLAVLRERPTLRGVAVPLALVWLTNAPAGVMATYTLALLGALRLVMSWSSDRKQKNTETRRTTLRLALVLAGGAVLGFALVCFYLLPAAYERRYVQVAMAIIPNLRYQDNFLFTHTAYGPHNDVTDRVSWIAVIILIACISAVYAAFFASRNAKDGPAKKRPFPRETAIALALLTAAVAFLLFPASSFLWEHLPNLKFMQFPWRLLTVLSPVLGLALAGLFASVARWKKSSWVLAGLFTLALSQGSAHLYRQRCEAGEMPAFDARAFATNHGVQPTDEYTPGDADNDVIRTDGPGYWLADDANAPASGTLQNPNEIYTNYDQPIPFENTVAQRAPQHLAITLHKPETLVLNLRDYPAWKVTRNGSEQPPHLHRDDGLIAIDLPAGTSTIDIAWRRTADQKLGDAISLAALVACGLTFRRSRKIRA